MQMKSSYAKIDNTRFAKNEIAKTGSLHKNNVLQTNMEYKIFTTWLVTKKESRWEMPFSLHLVKRICDLGLDIFDYYGNEVFKGLSWVS